MREEKRGGKRASKLSFDDLRTSVGWNSLRQELKFIASTRATSTYKKEKKKKMGFHRKSKGRYFGLGRLPTHATALQEVEILPTWFISILRVVLR